MHIRISLVMSLLLLTAALGGCSFRMPFMPQRIAAVQPPVAPVPPVVVIDDSENEVITIKRKARFATPEQEPKTAEEHLGTADFWLKAGEFHKAATHYDKAVDLAADPESIRRATCQAAVAWMLALEYRQFQDHAQRLRETYSQYELETIDRTDPKISALLRHARKIEDR